MADPKLPEFITERADGGLDVALLRGLDVSGAKVMTLTMREPDVSDQLAADAAGKSDSHKEVQLIANLAEQDVADIQRLKIRDYGRVQRALGFFYG